MQTKQCVICGGVYNVGEFSSSNQKNNTSREKHSYCNECHKAYNKANAIERGLTNPELRLALKEAKRCCKQMRLKKIVIISDTECIKKFVCPTCGEEKTIHIETAFIKNIETLTANGVQSTRKKVA